MGKELSNYMPNESLLNQAEVNPLREIFVEVNRKTDFDPQKISEQIARSLCEPKEELYKRNPKLAKDPIKAIESVSLVGGREEEITDPVEGLLVASAKLETARNKLNLSQKQTEVFDGFWGNVQGAAVFLRGKTAKTIATSVLIVSQALAAAGCKGVIPTYVDPEPSISPTVEVTDTPIEAYTPEVSPTETQAPTPEITPTKEVDFSELIPAYNAGSTAELKEEDILPDLDITTDAEKILREKGFGEQIDEIVKQSLDLAPKDASLTGHDFEVIYTLNTQSEKPVYSIFIFDKTTDFFLIPGAYHNLNKEDAKDNHITFSHSADITEIKNLLDVGEELYFWNILPPEGLGKNLEVKATATKTGVVFAAFEENNELVGWLDLEKNVWHPTSNVSNNLESLFNENDLETNLNNWLDNVTTIPEEDVFIRHAEPIKFNIFDPERELGRSTKELYYGVLLGTKVINDNLFAFMGFEDRSSYRFYLPFNLGNINDLEHGNLITGVESQSGKVEPDDPSAEYLLQDYKLILNNYINKPVIIGHYTGDWSKISSATIELNYAEEYQAQQNYSRLLSQFIYNSAFNPIGNNDFSGRVNTPLETLDTNNFPRVFTFYLAKR